MENPFYITGIIPEPYFCDREKETTWFVRTLENKAHILLTSPRRMGKFLETNKEMKSIKFTNVKYGNDWA